MLYLLCVNVMLMCFSGCFNSDRCGKGHEASLFYSVLLQKCLHKNSLNPLGKKWGERKDGNIVFFTSSIAFIFYVTWSICHETSIKNVYMDWISLYWTRGGQDNSWLIKLVLIRSSTLTCAMRSSHIHTFILLYFNS